MMIDESEILDGDQGEVMMFRETDETVVAVVAAVAAVAAIEGRSCQARGGSDQTAMRWYLGWSPAGT